MTKENDKCPVCGKETNKEHQPFCSKRCADLDLYKWLNGSYTIPTDETMDNDSYENNGVG